MAIVTKNSIDVTNHTTILHVVVNYIIIKYPYVNVIWLFILVSFNVCV